jgi:hypothetical protein
MAITEQTGDVKKIKVEGEGDRGKEVIIRHNIALPQWKTWNYDDFSRDWNKSYSSKKTKIDLK